jgi:DNA-binding Lrp family transcriptional regulator
MPLQSSNVQLDAIDEAILEVLQIEGRISNQLLAQRVT